MTKLSKNQTGFTAVEGLLIAVIVGIIGFTGWYVLHAQKATDKTLASSERSSSASSKPGKKAVLPNKAVDDYPGWKTYTRKSGDLSLRYPASWYFNASDNMIEVLPKSSQTSSLNAFSMHFEVLNYVQDIYKDEIMARGTTQKLSNGVIAWVIAESDSQTYEYRSTTKKMSCPSLRIVNNSRQPGYNIGHDQYLYVSAGYCQGERDGTDLSFTQQIASKDWQTAIRILGSIKSKAH